MRFANLSWKMFRWMGMGVALRICFLIWFMLGLPRLLRQCLYLHSDGFLRDGDEGAGLILLRTGVSNESNIATWMSEQHGGASVAMLTLNERTPVRISSLRHLPAMLATYARLAHGLLWGILSLCSAGEFSQEQKKVLPPVWFMLLPWWTPLMSYERCWAAIHLSHSEATHLYFTMNNRQEAAFMDALPDMNHAYVEHGFPRRDIPPLACKQYVYGKQYADYLRTFDAEVEIEEIGIGYFPKAEIDDKTHTIVVASLQDWPQWGIARVAERFNAALAAAKEQGWHIVFRGRNYDQDAFAQGLQCEWDEISTPKQESFAECLQRVKPALVWTTWSTAVLDAEAMGIRGVCFIDKALLNYFIPDFGRRTLEIDQTAASMATLETELCEEAAV